MAKKRPPLHPGEFLREEFLKPLKITPYRLAKDLNVPPQRIGDIVNVSAASAPRRRYGSRLTSTPRITIG